MTNAEYTKKKRELRALAAQERKEMETDKAIATHTPFWIVYDKISKIGCRCEAAHLRRGIYCKTCRLMKKVDAYLMDLFKNAAEGRGTSK
jgi:hypothetical protein